MHPLHYLGHDAGRPTSCLRSSVQHVEDFVQALTQSAQRCLGVVDAAEAERLREEATKWRGRAEAEAKATMEAKGRKHERTQAIWADHLYDVRLRFVMRTCFLALHREVLREGRRRPSPTTAPVHNPTRSNTKPPQRDESEFDEHTRGRTRKVRRPWAGVVKDINNKV